METPELATRTLRQHTPLGEPFTRPVAARNGCIDPTRLTTYLNDLASNTEAKIARRRERNQSTSSEEIILENRRAAARAISEIEGEAFHSVSVFTGQCVSCGWQSTSEADLLTTAMVARQLGVHPSRVRALAADRNVGQRLGRDWAFTPADVEAMRDRKPGRPSK